MKKTTTKTPLTLIIATVISCQTTDDKSQKLASLSLPFDREQQIVISFGKTTNSP